MSLRMMLSCVDQSVIDATARAVKTDATARLVPRPVEKSDRQRLVDQFEQVDHSVMVYAEPKRSNKFLDLYGERQDKIFQEVARVHQRMWDSIDPTAAKAAYSGGQVDAFAYFAQGDAAMNGASTREEYAREWLGEPRRSWEQPAFRRGDQVCLDADHPSLIGSPHRIRGLARKESFIVSAVHGQELVLRRLVDGYSCGDRFIVPSTACRYIADVIADIAEHKRVVGAKMAAHQHQMPGKLDTGVPHLFVRDHTTHTL